MLQIRSFIKIITTIAVVIGVTFFIAALAIGYHWLRAAVIMIGKLPLAGAKIRWAVMGCGCRDIW